jgi:hypothetical protein
MPDPDGKLHPTKMVNLSWISDADIDRVVEIVRPTMHEDDCRREAIVSLAMIAHGDFKIDPPGVARSKLKQLMALSKRLRAAVRDLPTYVVAGGSPIRVAAELQLNKLSDELDRIYPLSETLERRLEVKRSSASRDELTNQMRMGRAAERAFNLLHDWKWGRRVPTLSQDKKDGWIVLTALLFELATGKEPSERHMRTVARRCGDYLKKLRQEGFPGAEELKQLRREGKLSAGKTLIW